MPADIPITPLDFSLADKESNLDKAPLILNDPVFCLFSNFINKLQFNFLEICSEYDVSVTFKNGLILFSKMKPGPLELIETVEMYRLIENSYKIKMIKVNDVSKSVDNVKDLKEVRRLMKI